MITFTSVFAPQIEAMLAWRESLGYTRSTWLYPLLNFDRFCATRHPDQAVLTRELATQWCQEGTRVDYPAYKAQAIRAFGEYLRLTGTDAFVLPTEWISPRSSKLPHLFTDDELTAFFTATDRIPRSAVSPFREYTLPVLFRLILGCGLRPQEARLLRRNAVDVESAILTIERSKRNKDRRVPVGEDLLGLLDRFDQLAEIRAPGREYFFEQRPGEPYPGRWVWASYQRCLVLAGNIAPGSSPYALRHNYATRTLTKWVEQGRDLRVWLPYLTAFMGHDTYAATAYYIHLLPERLAATGLTSAAGIIPEVTT
ncbi:tyrosine-type recombinase/integrase [Microbacterium sp. USTB-Y]|uniref:tyrosine-type recombinase/integrase n=1 Tax=Microbacterium sp. USTB-Y TaxID=2823692 RepID=UPI00203BD0EF|nr:tyrosine-type recombinase/integrase [Microbacterium sp. USTB-Y]